MVGSEWKVSGRRVEMVAEICKWCVSGFIKSVQKTKTKVRMMQRWGEVGGDNGRNVKVVSDSSVVTRVEETKTRVI